MTDTGTNAEFSAEVADLRARLTEAEETLRAIRAGDADALVIAGSAGDEVHLLGSGDRIYRQFIETIREGTATVSAAGVIRSCSASLAQTLRQPLDQLIGTAMRDHLSPDDHEVFAAVLAQACPAAHRMKIRLKTSEDALMPVYLSATLLHGDGAEPVYCLVFTDLEEVISAERQLRESEAKYRRLFESMTDCFVQTGMSGEIVAVNPAFVAMLGYTEAELLRRRFQDLTPERWQAFEEQIVQTQILPLGYTDVYEKEYIRGDGTVFPVEMRTFLLRDGEGRPAGMWAIVRDISGRKEAEGRVLRLTQLYAALSKCNEAVVRSANNEELFTTICRETVQLGGMRMVWIGLVDEGSKQVLPVASCGEGVEYLQHIRISVDPGDPFGHGPTGTAIRESRPFWCQDFLHDPVTAPWRESGARFGWASSAALPLTRNGSPVGSLTLYAGKVGTFDDDTRRLLTEMASNISFALDKFAAEVERRSAVQALQESEERYRALFENSPDAVLLTAPDGRTLSANPAACRMFGRTAEELCALGRKGVIDTDDPRLARLLEERARTGKVSGELTFIRSDGSRFPGEISSLLFYDRLGATRTSMIIRNITERKQAEEELYSSRLLYQKTLSSLNEAVFIVDVETRLVLECNETTESIFGYSREELIGRDTRRIHVNDETLTAFAVEMNAQIERAGFAEFEFRMRRKNGEVFPTEHFLRPLRKSKGSRLCVVSVVRDITERKRAEDALQASRQLTEGIINAIPVRVFWKDRNLVFLGCNAAFARDAGFSDPQQVVGKDDFQMVWGEHADRYRGDDRRVIESGVPRLFIEEPQATHDGKTVTLLTSKLPLRNAAGEIIGVLGTYIDITGRKREEEEIRSLLKSVEHEKMNLSALISSITDEVWFADPQGRFTFVNSAAATDFCLTPGESVEVKKLAGQLEVLRPDGSPRPLGEAPPLRALAGELVVNQEEIVRVPATGELRYRQVCAAPVKDASGTIMGAVSVVRDITDAKRLAEEKAGIEARLRQSQKVEAIGRLAGGVAHDFNNLTAIVLGYGEMLLGHLPPGEPARKWVEQIVMAGKRSSALTRQLLAFSRRQVLLPVVMDLNDLLHNLQSMLERLIGENIVLTLDLADDLGCITADPGQVEQVVTNLVINARDAMPRGGKLTVTTVNADLDETLSRNLGGLVPGQYVMILLTDTGCGMDKATIGRLFEPFFTTKEKGKGTGLGLATAFGIVKQSGGYLYVDSEPDKGTTFTIYLPRTDAQPKPTASAPRAEALRGGCERVLVVEDEVSLRELCAVVLSRLGYRVSGAGSGQEALHIVKEQGFEPDLVVTDVVMPGMTGVEMMKQLRSDRPDLKVLYMSGYPDDAIAPHGVLCSGISFLPKPFSESIFAAKVREVLGDHKPVARPSRRVLMIDDDKQFIDLTGHFCRKRGDVFEGASSTAAALTALAARDFDVLLVDLNIPGTSGERVLREIRDAGHTAPAVVLTGDVAAACMDVLRPLGVVRVLEKSSDPEPLLRAIDEASTRADGPK